MSRRWWSSCSGAHGGRPWVHVGANESRCSFPTVEDRLPAPSSFARGSQSAPSVSGTPWRFRTWLDTGPAPTSGNAGSCVRRVVVKRRPPDRRVPFESCDRTARSILSSLVSVDRAVALVTGASRGIGRASAIALATEGFDVAITARTVREGDGFDESGPDPGARIPGSLETTALEIEAAGGRALPIQADLLDRASLLAATERVLGQWGRVDVLVNNAVHTGPGSMERFLDLDIDMVTTKLEANVVAQLAMIKSVLPGMLERGEGTIIDITSAVATSDPPAPTGEGGWGLGYGADQGSVSPSGRHPRGRARLPGHLHRERGARVRPDRAHGARSGTDRARRALPRCATVSSRIRGGMAGRGTPRHHRRRAHRAQRYDDLRAALRP